MGNPGRVYRQGGKDFFQEKKRGAKTFFGGKKGGQVFFSRAKKGGKVFFWGRKRGAESFFEEVKLGGQYFFWWKKGGAHTFLRVKNDGLDFFFNDYQIFPKPSHVTKIGKTGASSSLIGSNRVWRNFQPRWSRCTRPFSLAEMYAERPCGMMLQNVCCCIRYCC